jgi:hypothetical protein
LHVDVEASRMNWTERRRVNLYNHDGLKSCRVGPLP